MPAIVADELAKSYGETAALRGVSLTVEPGDVFVLIGPNGAGKTTLIRCLTGTTTPDSGSAALLGDPPSNLAKSRLGLLPQDFRPPTRLTALELVGYYGGLYDQSRDPAAVIDDVGLAASADTRYADLSGGQKRRTLVATALVNDPDVLFLDEPTTGIDPAGRRFVWSLLADLVETGTTIFLTTHSMAEAERLGDRVGVLVDGDIVAMAPPEHLIGAYGGSSQLMVETSTPVELDDFETTRTETGFVVDDVDRSDIATVVSALDEAGASFDALAWQDSDLESVYLTLTGQAPRSADRAEGRA